MADDRKIEFDVGWGVFSLVVFVLFFGSFVVKEFGVMLIREWKAPVAAEEPSDD